MVEVLGIIATLFILVSFIMKGERKIRSINIFGAVLFVVYGFFISSLSNIILNTALIFIHLYYLFSDRFMVTYYNNDEPITSFEGTALTLFSVKCKAYKKAVKGTRYIEIKFKGKTFII